VKTESCKKLITYRCQVGRSSFSAGI